MAGEPHVLTMRPVAHCCPHVPSFVVSSVWAGDPQPLEAKVSREASGLTTLAARRGRADDQVMSAQKRWHQRWGVRAAVGAALLLAVLAGCGDDDGADQGAPATTGTRPSSTTTSAASTTSEQAVDQFSLYLLPEDASDCSAVVPVLRTATGEGALDDAMAQLVAGPTPNEEAMGLRSWFSGATAGMVNSVFLEDGTALIDFDDFSRLIPNASSSCGSASLLAQLDRTALQFEGADRVIYSFDGDRAAFYEWLQLSAPE
jgi:hypothetical protein